MELTTEMIREKYNGKYEWFGDIKTVGDNYSFMFRNPRKRWGIIHNGEEILSIEDKNYAVIWSYKLSKDGKNILIEYREGLKNYINFNKTKSKDYSIILEYDFLDDGNNFYFIGEGHTKHFSEKPKKYIVKGFIEKEYNLV